MLRDGMTGDWLGTFLGHKGAVWSGKLNADGSKAVTGSADFTAKVWDTFTGQCTLTLAHNHIVRSADISPSGAHVVTGGQEKKIRLFDLERPEEPLYFVNPDLGNDLAHKENIKSVIYDDANQQIISTDEHTLTFWDIRTQKPISTSTFSETITSMDRSPSSSVLSLTSGKTVSFFQPSSSEPFMTHTLTYTPACASLHPSDSTKFVTGSTPDGWIRVHSAQTGEEKELYKGHHGPVHSISYSPDGELYASGSEDGTIRLWQNEPKTYGLWRFDSGQQEQQ